MTAKEALEIAPAHNRREKPDPAAHAEMPPHPESGTRWQIKHIDDHMRKLVSFCAVGGTMALGCFFFAWMGWQTLYGDPSPKSWISKIAAVHYAALLGTPMSAITAYCIVSLLKVTNGAIEFECLGFKFKGASGPIILWLLCFLATAFAFHSLWSDVQSVAP
jgi:hypothetical protein